MRKKFDALMEGKRVIPVSASFDAPQFARQFIDMARRSGRHRHLVIKHPQEINVVKRGKPAKKTVWLEYTQ